MTQRKGTREEREGAQKVRAHLACHHLVKQASLFKKAMRCSGNINNFVHVSCVVTATNETV